MQVAKLKKKSRVVVSERGVQTKSVRRRWSLRTRPRAAPDKLRYKT